MRTYHPASWSKQARNLANNLFATYKDVMEGKYNDDPKFVQKMKDEWRLHTFHSYRHPLIAGRAMKRFGRLVKQYNKRKGVIC